MVAGNYQIVQLYEEQGLSADKIAEALDLDLTAVTLTLQAESAAFRRATSSGKDSSKEPLVPYQEVVEAKRAISEIMRWTDDEHLKFRAAKFLLSEGLGRNDIKGVKNLNINVNLINEQLQRARQAIEVARSKTIDVPSYLLPELTQ